MLLTWSPYSNLTSKELLDASLKLPIPSGVEVNQNFGNWKESGKFITKYFKLFDINNYNDSVIVSLRKIDTIEQFELLSEFVKESNLILPDDKFMFFNGLKSAGILQSVPRNLDKALEDLYSGISELINNHNLYFNTLSDVDLNRVVHNITAYSLFLSIIDPIDLILSLESVDGPTEPIKKIANDPSKSQAAKDAKKSTPGNFLNKFESIVQNSEGKDGIAISAVALKGFFALTYYYDSILDSGDSELLKFLLNNHRNLLANVRAKNPSTIVNQEVVDILVLAGFLEDMAIQLSAMLGLSADNAKELALAKLNAGSKTISIYLYGLSVGLDFEKISTLMMGRTGRLIREIMDGDIYNGIDEYLSVEDALEYFTIGPKKYLSKYDITFLNELKIESPLSILNKSLHKWNGGRDKSFGKYSTPLIDFCKLCKKYKISLAELLKTIQSFENSYKSEIGKIKYLQLLDFVQDYLCQMNDINQDDFKKIEFLSKGASEMKRLGEIAGLNQGLPTDLIGLLNKISKIEDIFEDFAPKDNSKNRYLSKVKSILGEDITINLEKFAFDEKYRMNCIKAYNEIKHSFNILHAISTTPHLMGYVKVLAIAKMINMRSYKFRGIINNYRLLKLEFRGTKDDIISGLENYIGDKLISDWMLSKSLTITIPAGNYIFQPDGKLSENKTTSPTQILLGTDWGNASFKLWMENEVIPNLKQGKIKENVSETRVQFNSFIKDIGANIRTNTVSGNNQIVFSLPINMMPRTDSEQILLDKYIDSFDALKEFNYETSDNIYSIVDLFTYYSMIAFNWKQSQNSLVNIFRNPNLFPLILSLYKFESDMDKSRSNVEDEVLFKENIIPYIASKKGAYRSFGKYVWDVHPIYDVKQLMYKQPNNLDEFYMDDDTGYQRMLIKNGYLFIGRPVLDPNYFNTGLIRQVNEVIKKEFRIEGDDNKKKSVKTKIIWSLGTGLDSLMIDEYQDPIDGKLKKDFVLIKTNELPNGNLPMKIVNGTLTLDYDKIRQIIKLKLNGC